MGASLVASDSPGNLTFFPVFSLRTHALLRITPVDSSQSIYRSGGIVDRLDEESLSLLAKMSNDDSLQSIFIVRSLDFCGLDDIDGIFTLTKGLFKPKHPSPGELLDHISGFSPVFNTQPGLRAIEIPDSWNRNINAIIDDAESSKKNPVSVVCGAKDVGKSTFVRYFVNCLLNKHQKIAYLETDIGQSEFSPYGMITLHVLDSPLLGPPYTHQHLTPKRSHFFGAITPRDNPSHYLRCIHQLIDTWRLENSNAADTDQLPLVINTQGWIKGLGYDLMLDIIRDPVVTDIFALQSPQPFPPTFENDVTLTGEPLKQIQREVELRYVESVQKLVPVAKFVAYDLRVMSMVSYLYQNMAQFGKANELWWNFQSCLVERVPWSLDWRTGLNGIWVLWDDIKLSQLLYSLNGSLVALISDDVARERPTPAQGTGDIVPPTYFPPSVYPPPNPDTSFCLGFALVRAIDPSKHAFLFLTPLPAAKLKKVTGMVKGDIELPLCCMLDRQQTGGGGVARQPWRKVPYLTERVVEGLGGNAMQIRRVNRRVRK
ncbi:Pre-mRNA cleavage complex II protein Clp1-domain-containing protein [Dichotomocladium elegans]|nr:Pre-mRNA cleavage complex II protein Clp1-domain-containing protein [Dichotomocladium elegans]